MITLVNIYFVGMTNENSFRSVYTSHAVTQLVNSSFQIFRLDYKPDWKKQQHFMKYVFKMQTSQPT
jgi:hypothetical protein